MDRKTDGESKTRFRSERFFMSQGQWYCNVRENVAPLGPFPDKATAQRALRDYLLANGIDPEDDPWSRTGASN